MILWIPGNFPCRLTLRCKQLILKVLTEKPDECRGNENGQRTALLVSYRTAQGPGRHVPSVYSMHRDMVADTPGGY